MLNGSAVALFLAASFVGGPATSAKPQLQPEQPHRPEVERTDFESLQALIRRPVRLLGRGDLAGAEAAFEAELARHAGASGRRAIGYADRLMAMGLALFMRDEGTPRDAEMRQRSVDYFRRAIPATRSAFGADHRETALAIGTYAHAALDVVPDHPPAGLETLLAQAHRIYAAAYGANDITAARMQLHRAEVLGAPSRTRGDPAAIAAAAELFRRTVRAFEVADKHEFSPDLFPGELGIARMYVLHGRLDEAAAAAGEALAGGKSAARPEDGSCLRVHERLNRLADFMAKRGHRAEAEEMRSRLGAALCAVGPEPILLLGDVP